MTATQRIAAARKAIKKQGPCAFCGGRYAAHRVVDAEIGRIVAGDSMESTAQDFGTDVPTMLATWAALLDLLNEASIKESKKTPPQAAPSTSGSQGNGAAE